MKYIKIILSCIASLVDNKRSFSYFIQWKSKTNSNIDSTKLLINIYRLEDEKYGVKYENGILQVKNDRPLNPNTSYLIRKQQKIEDAQNAKKRLRITKQTNQESFLGINKKNTNSLRNTKTNGKDNNMEGTNSSLGANTSSLNSTNLSNREYLNQIYRSEDFVESYLNHKITEITKSFDLRETIFSIFYRIGFNNISINSNDDRQTFVSIKMYPIFKNLENWEDVVEEFKDTNFNPIGDDQNWIKTQIEDSKEKMNLETDLFGIAGGFSSLRDVTEHILPVYYNQLLTNLPPDEMLTVPQQLPARWESYRTLVVEPYIKDSITTSSTEPAPIFQDYEKEWRKKVFD